MTNPGLPMARQPGPRDRKDFPQHPIHTPAQPAPQYPSTSRLRLLAARLHALGPRATYELILELFEGADVLDRLEAYAAIDRDFLHALGGDALPSLRAIGGVR
jgi:hypothetical protein